MKKQIAIALLLLLPFQSNADTQKNKSVRAPNPHCMCTQEYAPVCGENGMTYGNKCKAHCADVKVVSIGHCPKKH